MANKHAKLDPVGSTEPFLSYPLSDVQQNLYSQTQGAGHLACQTMQCELTLFESINRPLFWQAWKIVVAQYEALRTSVHVQQTPQPLQRFHHEVKLPAHTVNLAAFPAKTRRAKYAAIKRRDREQGFELTKPPLLRFHLVKLNQQEYRLLWTYHRIILDRESAVVVLQQVLALYDQLQRSRAMVLSPCTTYEDFLQRWQKIPADKHASYWADCLAGFNASHKLLIEQSNFKPAEISQVHYELNPAVIEQLIPFARQYKFSLNMLVQAAWGVLLAAYSGVNDVVFGVVRRLPQPIVQDCVGVFMNTLPMRCKLSPDINVLDYLQAVRDQYLNLRHQCRSSLQQVMRSCHWKSQHPLFTTAVDYIRESAEQQLQQSDPRWQQCRLRFNEQTYYQLYLRIIGKAGRWTLAMQYNPDNYTPQMVQSMARQLESILLRLVQTPCLPVTQLTVSESHRLAVESSECSAQVLNNQAKLPLHKTVVQLLGEQALRFPHAIALRSQEEQLSYSELLQKVEQLAQGLQQRGVMKGALVAHYCSRSIDALVAMLALWRIHAVYVPISGHWPLPRVQALLAKNQLSVLLFNEPMAPQAQSLANRLALTLCPIHELLAEVDECAPLARLQAYPAPQSLAYVMFTSGSSGEPKGVMVSHQALVNTLFGMKQLLGLKATDRILALTGFSFDISLAEMLLPLISGARCVIANETLQTDSMALKSYLAHEKITLMQATPVIWRELLSCGWRHTTAMKVLCGGERLELSLAKQLTQHGQTVWNFYGPTEATIWATCHRFSQVNDELTQIPIGQPLLNVTAKVLDNQQQLVASGVPGELYLGGMGLAEGYLNQADLSAKAFVANPFADNAVYPKLYRTGDLVYYTEEGLLEYIGRCDRQIKYLGHRIELGEIEHVLSAHEEVLTCACVQVKTGHGHHDWQLVAYVVASSRTQRIDGVMLNQYLREQLPHYMIPHHIIQLENLPLTTNKKIDYQALANSPIKKHCPVPVRVRPNNFHERALYDLWQQLLKLEPESFGVCDNFFTLGGNSLLATQLVSSINRTFMLDFTIKEVFEYPTIEAIALHIHQLQRLGRINTLPSIEPHADNQQAPLSFAQERLWTVARLEENNSLYNIFGCYRLEGKLDSQRFLTALQCLVDRHEALRLRIVMKNNEPVQQVLPVGQIRVNCQVENCCNESASQLRQLFEEEQGLPFNLSQAPLWRFRLIQAKDCFYFLMSIHHIIMDEWSLRIFFQDLQQAYHLGKKENFPSFSIEYVDFASWQRQQFTALALQPHLTYWRQQLKDLPELRLSTDFPRPKINTHLGKTQAFTVAKGTAMRLRRLAVAAETTLFNVLLSALDVLLSRYTNQEDIVIGSPVSGRHYPQVGHLLGFFLNTLVFRSDLSGDINFITLLQRNKRTILDAFSHQEVPFEEIVKELAAGEERNKNPLFQICFVLETLEGSLPQLNEITATQIPIDYAKSKFDFTLFLMETPQGLQGKIEYSTDLFLPATIDRLIKNFTSLLKGITDRPEQPLTQLSLNDNNQLQRLLSKWQPSRHKVIESFQLEHWITRKLLSTQQQTAWVDQHDSYSYQQLLQLSTQCAAWLQLQGVTPGATLVTHLKPGFTYALCLLTAMRYGFVLVPLAIQEEPGLLQQVLRQCQPQAVIADPELTKASQSVYRHANIHLFPSALLRKQIATQEETSVIFPEPMPPYLLIHYQRQRDQQWFSCPLRRQCIHDYYQRADNLLKPALVGQWLVSFPTRHALACFELLTPLVNGCVIYHTVPPVSSTSPRSFFKSLVQQPVKNLLLTPALLNAFIDFLQEKSLSFSSMCFETILLAGAEINGNLLARFRSISGADDIQLLGLYCCAESPLPVLIQAFDNLHFNPNSPPLLGKPISGVKVLVLDPKQQPVPLGSQGELYLSSHSLVQEYLNEPEHAEQRFYELRINDQTLAKFFRTRDLVRWNSRGELEYLGRVEDQIVIRGNHVDPTLVEYHLNQHAAINFSLVTSRKLSSGCQHLLAYLQLNDYYHPLKSQQCQLQKTHLQHWQTIYDEVFNQEEPGTPSLPIGLNGWHSSYTGHAIPGEEMAEWLENTLLNVQTLPLNRVLDIGCGMGSVFRRIVNQVDEYMATDFSEIALQKTRERWYQENKPSREKQEKVQFICRDAASGFPGEQGAYDSLLLNSVVQYFPDEQYLDKVIAEGIRMAVGGGVIYVGDVRSESLLSAYHASVQIYHAKPVVTLRQLRYTIQKQVQTEKELVLNPGYFYQLPCRHERISHVVVQLKAGVCNNELNCFRYDVFIHLNDPDEVPQEPVSLYWQDWSSVVHHIDDLETLLTEQSPELLALRTIPNARVAGTLAALDVINDPEMDMTVSDLKHMVTAVNQRAVAPYALVTLAKRLGYYLHLGFCPSGNVSCFSVVFYRPHLKPLLPQALFYAFQNAENQATSPGCESNQPLVNWYQTELTQQLRDHLSQRLPYYMIPSQFIFLNTIPLTPMGNIDRSALPMPELPSNEVSHEPPMSAIEKSLRQIWQEILNQQEIGVGQTFFELGGHSLLAIQAVEKIRKLFQIELSVQVLISGCTIAQLAKKIAKKLQRAYSNEQVLPSDCIQVLHAHGQQSPLFLVHPVSGAAFSYYPLVNHLLLDRPVYALVDPGIHDKSLAAFNDLTHLAAYYATRLREVQPEGPYLLAGFQFGGNLAVAIAEQLIMQGQAVLPVILFDSWAKQAKIAASREYLAEAIRRQYQHLRACLLHESLPNPESSLSLNYQRQQLLLQYVPKRINVDLILFKAKSLRSELHAIDDACNHWDSLTERPMRVIAASGDHETMLLEPNVQQVAAKLVELLGKCEMNHRSTHDNALITVK